MMQKKRCLKGGATKGGHSLGKERKACKVRERLTGERRGKVFWGRGEKKSGKGVRRRGGRETRGAGALPEDRGKGRGDANRRASAKRRILAKMARKVGRKDAAAGRSASNFATFGEGVRNDWRGIIKGCLERSTKGVRKKKKSTNRGSGAQRGLSG